MALVEPLTPAEIKKRYPFYALVPKDLKSNLAYRRRILAWARSSESARAALMEMCRRDFLFFVNTFCWIFSPKNPAGARWLPFITFEYQDPAFAAIQDAMGKTDLVIEKSREMAASWMVLTYMFWEWLFVPFSTFLLGSRKEELVDKTDKPGCLFWKIDKLLEKLPWWMRPRCLRIKLHLGNQDNGSMFDGEATNPDFGRGDRPRGVLVDEAAHVPDDEAVMDALEEATDSRYKVSTPNGMANDFAKCAHNPEIPKLRLGWWVHPLKNRGLYYDANGKPRSPWYDKRCKKAGNPARIASQYDISYLGSSQAAFDHAVINRLMLSAKNTPPILTGRLNFDPETLEPREFVQDPNGNLHLWIGLDGRGNPPRGNYVEGCDISAGSGHSNSTISIGDRRTGLKVAEFADPNIDPRDLAKLAVALAKWFGGKTDEDGEGGAFIIWEANGVGGIQFTKQMIKIGYFNVYWRQDEQKVGRKPSDKPGWQSTIDLKNVLLDEYSRALNQGQFVNPSYHALEECMHYVTTPSGATEHQRVASSATTDVTGARKSHGDRVIADALLWKEMRDTVIDLIEKGPEIRPNTFAWRQRERQEKRSKQDHW